ncbi:hypothetical protein K457DRAFT_26089 [Linnemannia elongata AG-77]|uniref:Uncharacterized protein n=1 Tax=Linnemannia elongata AG-77 TaxID=1314771 RepID=A0A197JBL4_9FUNG|nr:hypothetical protein K457DRAFT_26089 [Linnemannia elongata AG-77]
MDPSLAEDDQVKDMIDDTLEVGGGGSESMTNDRSGLDKTASSEKGIAGVDSAKDICELSAQTYHVSHEAKKYRAGQILSRYSCHRKSSKYQDKSQVKGGKMNKSGVQLLSIRCKCRSHINATFRPRSTSNGMPGDTYKVEYFFEFTRFLEGKETKKLSNPTIASPNATFRPNNRLEFQVDSPTTGFLEDNSRHDESAPTIFDGCSNTRQRFQFH